MSIEREGREQYFECDEPGCMAREEIPDGDFKRTWERLKRKGWETKAVGPVHNQTWLHACPRHML